MVSKCFVPGCKTGYQSDIKKRQNEGKKKLSLFRPPKAEDKLEQWKKAISRPDRELGKRDQICELHFLPEQISRHFVHKMPDDKIVVIKRAVPTLVTGAVPTIFPNLQSNLNTNNKRSRKSPVKRKPLSKKAKRDNTDNTQQEEISRLFVDKMPDGKIVVIEREKPTLTTNAVSTKCPNLSTNNKRNRKSPFKRKPLSKKAKRDNTDNTQSEEISCLFDDEMPDDKIVVTEREKPTLTTNAVSTKCPNLIKIKRDGVSPFQRMPLPKVAKRDNTDNTQLRGIIIETASQFTFNVLLKNLSHVSKPHNLWAVSSHEDFIVCVKWDLNFNPERQIIVDADLGIKIKYHGTEVPIIPNTVIESVESLSLMLKEVDQYIVCPGAIKGNNHCLMYVKREYGLCGRPRNWCNGCVRNVSKYHLKQNMSRPSFKIYRNCQWTTSANQKNAHLEEKDLKSSLLQMVSD